LSIACLSEWHCADGEKGNGVCERAERGVMACGGRTRR
jgi:hypothetical protein